VTRRSEGALQVSVVIPHAGDTTHLERCLDSLVSERICEVLVVTPETASASLALVERHPRARAVQVPRLLSFARATNLGASMANGDLLLLLNDDTVVQDGAIERLAGAFGAQSELGAAGPLLLNSDGSRQPSVYSDPSWRALGELILRPLFQRGPLVRSARFPYATAPDSDRPDVWLSGAALMVRRDLFADVGALDEGYPHGIEDAVLCRAIRDRGRRLEFVEAARVVHEGSVSSYRSKSGAAQVAKALMGGTTGWVRYWRARGAGRGSTAALRAAFLLFGVSRVAAYAVAGIVPGPGAERHRARRAAYARYVRLMLSRGATTP
jgi:GT2 family glycosyltransferase